MSKVWLLGVFVCISIFDARATSRISVMTFNVENLFDLKDAPGKSDETYLPLRAKNNASHYRLCAKIKIRKWREDCFNLDWSENALSEKLRRIGLVIKSVGNGRGPDIVSFQEVENIGLLSRLIREHLSGLGYRPILIEGDDERGIDVGIITRFKTAGPARLHSIKFPAALSRAAKATRGILEVPLQTSAGEKLRVFALHLPSAFHPVSLREAALSQLNGLAKRHVAELVIAGGDFNITSEEDAKNGMLRRFAAPEWNVAHLAGCVSCKGTVFHKKWSFFDQIWVTKSSALVGWQLSPGSVRVVNNLNFQRHPRRPGPQRWARSSWGYIEGLSDHWPLYLELEKIKVP